MDQRKQQLDEFFARYADRTNKGLEGENPDIDATLEAFAEHFIEASPLGIVPGKNGKEFRQAIPKGYELYKKIGITSMDILSKEITLLDEFHSMVKVKWSSAFIRKDKSQGTIEFDVFYFLQTIKEGEHKIFGYITGDEQKALKLIDNV